MTKKNNLFVNIPPQCISGLIPPVCAKQVNDFVRDKFTNKDDSIAFYAEILAGGCVSSRPQTQPSVLYLNSRK